MTTDARVSQSTLGLVELPTARHRVDGRVDTTASWARNIPPDRFGRLTQDIHRAIVVHAGSPDADDALLETVVGQAVEMFVQRAGHPVAAALQMEPLMRRIGAREAAIGRSFDVLHTSMRVARATADAYLPRLLAAHPLTADHVADLRDDLVIFLDQLRDHARAGFDRQWSMEEMGAEEAEQALRRMLFDIKAVLEPSRLALLAKRARLTLPETVQPLVCLDATLPREVLAADDLVVGLRPNEAMLFQGPDDVLGEDRAARLASALPAGAVLIVGVPGQLVEATRTLGITRRAAAMVSAGRMPRPVGVLFCDQALGQIATATDPYLLDALATRHLTALEGMSAARRLDLGELLLEWLETGASVNEIARRRDLHTQTLHSRMRTLRSTLGNRLTDADARVELILALRHVLPRWRDQASARSH